MQCLGTDGMVCVVYQPVEILFYLRLLLLLNYFTLLWCALKRWFGLMVTVGLDLMYGAAYGYAPDYITSLVTLTSATSGRSHLHSADSLTFDIPRTRMRMGDRALSVAGLLVCAPGTHFLLTFVVHPAWTLLRSVSNHICFLLLMIYNNFLYPSNCLLLCILCTVIICTVLATSRCKHFLY